MTSIAAVLCDMDGTLVDSEAAVERAWRGWARRWGVDPAAVLAVMAGHPSEATVRRMRPDLEEPVLAAAIRDIREQECRDVAGVVAQPGAHALVDALTAARVPWAVVTSADSVLAARRLQAAGIDAALVVGRDDVTAGKPAPEAYLLAATRLGVDPADCLVVEDTPTGAAAGRAAGARVAGLNGIDADLALADLTDLLPLLTPGAAA